MVHCGRARRTRDAWKTPRTMSAARTSTIPDGSTMIPSAGPRWRPQVCKATSAWPGMGNRVDGLLDVYAAARGLIQKERRAARAAACPTAGSAPSSGPGRGCCLGHHSSPVQWPRFHAGQRAGTLPAGAAGSAGVLPAGGSRTISRSESAPASSFGGSPSPPLSPSALMTSCAATSCSAIVVSLCLRAGDGVRIFHGCCTCCGRGGAWVGKLERWLRVRAFARSCGH